MRMILIPVAALALFACQKNDTASNDAAANAAMANDAMAANDAANAAAAATPAAMTSINSTSWEYTDPKTKKALQESVDATGNYITVAGKDHFDHGTAVMKDGKACFTSAMNKDGEMCWTNPMLAVGATGETTSDKGDKLSIKRTDYVALTM